MKPSHFARNLRACLLRALGACSLVALAQVPPVGVKDQAALLKSSDAKLAANKKLVYDMYRTIVNGGHYELADKFFTKEYIQHNPNVNSGRDELVAYIKQTRPQAAAAAHHLLPADLHHRRRRHGAGGHGHQRGRSGQARARSTRPRTSTCTASRTA